MKIPWNSPKCILCLNEKPLTVEHLIPKCLGGRLTSKFLCKDCNSNLGAKTESEVKKSPAIRAAIDKLANDLPLLYDAIENRQSYTTEIGAEKLVQTLGKDGTLGERRLQDGSLLVPEDRAKDHLRNILLRQGLAEASVNEALQSWEDAATNETIQLTKSIAIKKWENLPAIPYMDGSDVKALVILKIVYEFVALILGTAVLEPNPELARLREILRTADETAASTFVRKLEASQYAAFHGICFHGNGPNAKFQVRLFGKLAYLIELSGIGLNTKPIVYTLDLKSGNHDIREFSTKAS